MFIQLKTTQRNIRLQDYSLTTPVYINKCYLQKYTLIQKTFFRTTELTIIIYEFFSGKNNCQIENFAVNGGPVAGEPKSTL